MIKSILIVGCGSFVGGALRYLISMLMKNECASSFPVGTLVVNILGCFLIGIIYGLFVRYSTTSHMLCLLLTTGFCGGFTTFSTFANESLQMLQAGNVGGFVGYVAASLVLGILLVLFGYYLVK
ncbi:MAG: fluoride efflux transporter CrcB [Bacteroides sp.]|nr:fluoride efflux transporter CrcB [Bacteroides sp.]